jgi:hypothetical protein
VPPAHAAIVGVVDTDGVKLGVVDGVFVDVGVCDGVDVELGVVDGVREGVGEALGEGALQEEDPDGAV